jgi:hypothetical protein
MAMLRVLGAGPLDPCWVDRIGPLAWPNWARFEGALRSDPKWERSQVDSIDAESLRVLRHLHDPMQAAPYQDRGLVVGYVQSGKTANYTAVAARAADAGYRIIIVLSGVHDSLRRQTQRRLERELTGGEGGGAGWVLLTEPIADFQGCTARVLAEEPGNFLLVAKKNVAILGKIDQWLEEASRFLADMPILLVDDEADQASINTRGNRMPDAAVSDDEADDDRDRAPSKTNGLIRSILRRAPKAAYIAYTATPFANILIDPFALDRMVGEDLFPKDFVIQLPRPRGYTGTEELFGASTQHRQVLRTVPEEDVKVLRAPKKRKSMDVTLHASSPGLPDTLRDAVLWFCIAGGIRSLRSRLAVKSHTMLVHVSQRTADQERVADSIREQLEVWRDAERQGQRLEPIFERAWAANREGVDAPADDAEVVRASIAVMRELAILVLNSVTGEDLEYDEKPGRHIIAVGGNRLSRGLTLEGLTVSYFLRTATMCDTLLQMARWYGFRIGYEDLIRIWTTDGIARLFTELSLVEQSLRDSIVSLGRAGRRPDQMAIRLRAHSSLLLTARNKALTATKQWDSWSGGHPQTVLLPLTDPSKLLPNRHLANHLLSSLPLVARGHGGLLAQDLSPELVCGFLRSYQTHEDVVAFRSGQLADWIIARAAAGELTDWSVFVASPASERQVSIGGRQIGLVRRSRVSSESIGILTDPRHEGVDLPLGPDGYRRASGVYDAEAMRAARPPTQGLMLVYPLDAAHLGVTATDVVVALALSLPHTSDSGTSWIVNSGVPDA